MLNLLAIYVCIVESRDEMAISRVDPLGNSAIEYRYFPEFEPTWRKAADHKRDKNNKSILNERRLYFKTKPTRLPRLYV